MQDSAITRQIESLNLSAESEEALARHFLDHLFNLARTGNLAHVFGVTLEMEIEIATALRTLDAATEKGYYYPSDPGIARLLQAVCDYSQSGLEKNFFVPTAEKEAITRRLIDAQTDEVKTIIIFSYGLYGEAPRDRAEVCKILGAEHCNRQYVTWYLNKFLGALHGEILRAYGKAHFFTAESYPLIYLGLSVRGQNRLQQQKRLKTIADLIRLTPEKLQNFRGIGSEVVKEIEEALADCGYVLAKAK